MYSIFGVVNDDRVRIVELTPREASPAILWRGVGDACHPPEKRKKNTKEKGCGQFGQFDVLEQ